MEGFELQIWGFKACFSCGAGLGEMGGYMSQHFPAATDI